MRHARAAQRLHKRLLDHAVFHVERQLACALLRRAPAYAVRQAGNIRHILRLYPVSLFRNGRGAVIAALGDDAHLFHFMGIFQFHSLLSVYSLSSIPFFPPSCKIFRSILYRRPHFFNFIRFFFRYALTIGKLYIKINNTRYGGIAQLARAFGSYPNGHWFKSNCRYQASARWSRG